MISDIFLIVRKEWKEMFQQRGGLKSGFLNLAIFLIILGVFMPLQSGPEWLSNPLVPLAWSWLPIMLTMGMVTDGFAGERERHTLETLLASRMSDKAIVLGKWSAAVLYGWAVAEAGGLLAAVTINLANPAPVLRFYPPQILLGCLLLPLLASGLMAGLGTFVSMHASSVRQAYQQLSIGMLVLFVLPIFGIQFLPETWRIRLFAWADRLNFDLILLGLGLVFLVIDIALIAAAVRRFHRAALVE